MTETIEIEVTESVKKQYDELVDQFGEDTVQTDLLQAIVPPIQNGYHQLQNDQS